MMKSFIWIGTFRPRKSKLRDAGGWAEQQWQQQQQKQKNIQ